MLLVHYGIGSLAQAREPNVIDVACDTDSISDGRDLDRITSTLLFSLYCLVRAGDIETVIDTISYLPSE